MQITGQKTLKVYNYCNVARLTARCMEARGWVPKQQNALGAFRQCSAKIYRRRCFANAALLIRDGNDFHRVIAG